MKRLFKLLSIPGALALGLLAGRRSLQRRVLKGAEANVYPSGASSAEAVTLGGVKQWILVQGEDRTRPVLLVLHGAPGMPFPGVAYRSYSPLAVRDSELARYFVLVYWDQRGAGKSSAPKESITLKRLLSDTLELADLLRERFGVEKIFLLGISWGTVLGLNAAARHPEKFYAYIGWGQIANWAESDRLRYRWALEQAQQAGNRKAIKQLTKLGPPPWKEFEQWSMLRKWLMLFGGVYRSESTSGWRSCLSRAIPFLSPGLPALLLPSSHPLTTLWVISCAFFQG